MITLIICNFRKFLCKLEVQCGNRIQEKKLESETPKVSKTLKLSNLLSRMMRNNSYNTPNNFDLSEWRLVSK